MNFLLSNLKSRGSTLILMSSSASAQIIAFFSVLLVARIYSTYEFSVFSTYTSISIITLSVSALRLDQAIIYCKSSSEVKFLTGIAINLSIYFSLFAGVAFTCLVFLSEVNNIGLVALYFCLTSLSIFVASLLQIGLSLRTSQREYILLSRDRFIQISSTPILQILYGLLSPSVLGLIGGDLSGRAAGLLSLRKIFSVKDFRMYSSPAIKRTITKYKQYTITLSSASLVSTLAQQIPFLLIPVYYPSSKAGIYFLMSRFVMAPLAVLVASVAQVYQGDISKLEIAKVQSIYKKNFKFVSTLTVLTCSTFALFSPIFVRILLGSDSDTASQLILPICLSLIFWGPASALSGTLVMANMQSTTLKYAIADVILKTLCIIGLSQYGILIASYAVAAISAILYISNSWRSSKVVGMGISSLAALYFESMLKGVSLPLIVFLVLKIL